MLWNYPYNDMDAAHVREWKQHKARERQQKTNDYPSWILDRAGIEVMLANRVHMGASIQPPHFRWVPYVDALLFPLDNSQLAQKNSDRKAFYGLEDALLKRYLSEAGVAAPPATLDEYVARIVTPTLERHKQGGAVAESSSARARSVVAPRVQSPAPAYTR